MEPSGSVQNCNGIALPLACYDSIMLFSLTRSINSNVTYSKVQSRTGHEGPERE
jgi:hypothetical protein